MLNDIECKYIIVGHSERRIGKYETNNDVALKAKNVMENKMCPIICVGEDAKDRDAGNALNFIEKQLNESIPKNYKDFIIAYEPIWAIGTGKTATAEQAQDVHSFIRERISNHFGQDASKAVRIQYGGSMKGSNAEELLSQPDIDGGLIGGASLDAQSFGEILRIAIG